MKKIFIEFKEGNQIYLIGIEGEGMALRLKMIFS